jgi:hypothetical protein
MDELFSNFINKYHFIVVYALGQTPLNGASVSEMFLKGLKLNHKSTTRPV